LRRTASKADGLEDDLLHDDNLSIRTIMHWLKHCLKVPEGYELDQFI
jgi:hypothetical protein